LKQYRYLCDVATDVDLNYDYAVKASAACRLLDLVGHLDHKPAKPPGCSESLYKVGFDGTSHSNLYQASWSPTAVQSVDAWMDDSDPSNIDRVGHRNWLLNAAQKQCAFGAYKNFAAFYAMDSTRTPLPYDAVLYPSRGYFPISHWRKDAAWSAHLSKDYAPAKDGEVKVTVTPLDANMKKGAPVELDYFHIDGGGFGVGSSCIIFKPRATVAQGARYWVAIKGLHDSSGETTLEYLVEFY
jgi:hypothetical protein